MILLTLSCRHRATSQRDWRHCARTQSSPGRKFRPCTEDSNRSMVSTVERQIMKIVKHWYVMKYIHMCYRNVQLELWVKRDLKKSMVSFSCKEVRFINCMYCFFWIFDLFLNVRSFLLHSANYLDSSSYAHFVFNTFDREKSGSISFEVSLYFFTLFKMHISYLISLLENQKLFCRTPMKHLNHYPKVY